MRKQGLHVKIEDRDKGFIGFVPAANATYWNKGDEMKPGNLFQILDLPIIDSFFYNHGETLNKVLFKKDLALYKEINIDEGLINEAFRKVKDSPEDIKKLFQDGKMIKKLIGVDIYEFLDLIKIKV